MRSESFSFSWIKDNHLVAAFVSKQFRPFFLDWRIEPHEFVFSSSLDFSIILSIKGFKLVFELFAGLRFSDKNDAQSTFCGETQIFAAFLTEFWN